MTMDKAWTVVIVSPEGYASSGYVSVELASGARGVSFAESTLHVLGLAAKAQASELQRIEFDQDSLGREDMRLLVAEKTKPASRPMLPAKSLGLRIRAALEG